MNSFFLFQILPMMHVFDYLMNEKEREYFKIHAEGGMIDFEEPSTEEDEGGNNVDEDADVSTIYESVRNRPQSTPKKSAKQNKRQPPPEDSDSEIEFTAPARKSPKTAKLANKETTPKKRRLYNAVSKKSVKSPFYSACAQYANLRNPLTHFFAKIS